MSVVCVWATPFSARKPAVLFLREGLSVSEIVEDLQDRLPSQFVERGQIRINGEFVPRALWRSVRPKASSAERPIAVTFHIVHENSGGGGGAKQIIGLVAALALTVVTGGIASGAILGTFTGMAGTSLFGSATVGAAVLAGAVGLAGSLAISALTSAPVLRAGDTSTDSNGDDNRSASASGNAAAEPGGSIDRVIGTTKVYPRLVGQPVISIENRDDIVEAVFVLNGPHKIEDLRIDEAPFEASSDIQVQYREGWQDDQPIDLVNRYGRQTGAQFELSAHTVDSEDMAQLLNRVNPSENVPKWHGVPTRRSPDEVWCRFTLPAMGYRTTEDQLVIPIRTRIRLRGTTQWRNLPEFHISAQSISPFKNELQLKWDMPEPTDVPTVPSKNGVYFVAKATPGQTNVPVTAANQADGYFSAGSGNDYLYRGTESTSNVRHVFAYDNRIVMHLTSAAFPRGIYDIQMKRGFSYKASDFSKSNYQFKSAVTDFFWFTDNGTIAESRENKGEQIVHQFTTSVYNAPILPTPGFATIAVLARNAQINNVSCMASGYVRDYDPATGKFDKWVTTSNPVPHYVDVHIGGQNVDPLPEDLLDLEEMIEWRQRCIDAGYTCNEIIVDQSIDDVRSLIASCGYAKPYQSDLWSVVQDYDRSQEPVVQVFSPRNARGFSFNKAFPKLPDGFRINYRDKTADYATEEVVVFRNGYDGGEDGKLEGVYYGGLDDETQVVTRARFDLAQAEKRATFYSWEAPAEAIVCRRGSLVAIEHDTLARHTGRARIKEVLIDPATNLITGVRLDSVAPILNTPDMHAVTDMHAVVDMHTVGIRTAVAVRRTNGWITTHLTSSSSDEETDLVTFASPLADLYAPGSVFDPTEIPEISAGCLVIVGDHDRVYKRVIVSEMQPTTDLIYKMVAVDEAPELWADGLSKYVLQESGSKVLQETSSGLFWEP